VKPLDKKIELLMKNLEVSEEEAKEIVEYDKAVDKMTMTEVEADLTPEQKEAIKKFKNVATKTAKKPFVPDLKTRPRKENGTKRGIIEDIYNALLEKGYENLTIVKAEKEISFDMGGDNYSISLICHRKPKK
jgi:hypothetical protein